MEFTTTLTADVENILFGIIPEELRKEVDIVIDSSKVTVKWSLEIEANESGVKSMIASVRSIRGDIDWEVDSEYLSPEESKDFHAKGADGILMNNDKIEGHI